MRHIILYPMAMLLGAACVVAGVVISDVVQDTRYTVMRTTRSDAVELARFCSKVPGVLVETKLGYNWKKKQVKCVAEVGND